MSLKKYYQKSNLTLTIWAWDFALPVAPPVIIFQMQEFVTVKNAKIRSTAGILPKIAVKSR